MHSPVREEDLPDVSIIIPAWNSEKTLPDVLRGIERQDYPGEKVEIIVVDNGSADATQRLAIQAGATLHVNEESKNPYLSRNMGAERATGDILVFLDATCAPEQGWLRSGVSALFIKPTDAKGKGKENHSADLAAGAVHFDLGPIPGLGEWLDSITFVDTERYVTRDQCAPGGNLFVRKECWEALGPFPTRQRSGADMAWTQHATRSGYQLRYVPEAAVRYPARPWRAYLAKYHRIGEGVGRQWRQEGRSLARAGWEILKTGGPPSPGDLRDRIKRRGNEEMYRWFWSLWTLEWMGRWALATGRARGYVNGTTPSAREEKRTKEESRPVLAFLYYSYYPIRGGASVHGAKLAEALHRLGHRLVKLNGEPDPWSDRWPSTLWSALKLLFEAEKVYARVDFLLNGRNALTAVALLTGRRVVVELNCPSDELFLSGASERRIYWSDRLAGFLLRRACAVVVVSEALDRYAREALGVSNVHIVENGGEVLDLNTDPVGTIRKEIRDFISSYPTLALWSGTPTGLQSVSWVRELARRCPELGIVMAVNRETGTDPVLAEERNVCILENRTRQEIVWLIARAQIGLAFYEPMPWSRWGFYLSPLKIPEFLNSGRHVISNAPGSKAQRACPGFHGVQSVEKAIEVAQRLMKEINESKKTDSEDEQPRWPSVRTWDQVAEETDQILKSC